MHENYDYYQNCQTRRRNQGLFTADQNLRRTDARATRQNPNGNRNGFECPEERDYYPYWHPTPWRDIAVVVSNYQEAKREYYWLNSEDSSATMVDGKVLKGFCVSQNNADKEAKKEQRVWYNNAEACESHGHRWETKVHRKNLQDPTSFTKDNVVRGQFSRTNHLGAVASGGDTWEERQANGISAHKAFPHGDSNARYLWTVPDMGEDGRDSCVLRIRYNISSSDYDAWNNGVGDYHGEPFDGIPGVNATFNGQDYSPITQDPYTYFGADGSRSFLSLALNTNQYGRTFQDRSYTFKIKRRPENIPNDANIYNLNVMGKRGNIVQTYPAIEYKFVPEDLRVKKNDYVHFQWTGSDYNPRRGCNDGEGGPPDPPSPLAAAIAAAASNSRADRSNVVMMQMGSDNTPSFFEHGRKISGLHDPETSMFASEEDALALAFLDQHSILQKQGLQCLKEEELEEIPNKNVRENHPQNCAKLNAASSPHFNHPPVKMENEGRFTFFSSRNNNLSNRDQTGKICVGSTSECTDEDLTADVTPERVFRHAPDPSSGISRLIMGELLGVETTALETKENDALGDGNEQSCEAVDRSTRYAVTMTGMLIICLAFTTLGVLGTLISQKVRARVGGSAYKSMIEETGRERRDRDAQGARGVAAMAPQGNRKQDDWMREERVIKT